jgi:hypothetical protein
MGSHQWYRMRLTGCMSQDGLAKRSSIVKGAKPSGQMCCQGLRQVHLMHRGPYFLQPSPLGHQCLLCIDHGGDCPKKNRKTLAYDLTTRELQQVRKKDPSHTLGAEDAAVEERMEWEETKLGSGGADALSRHLAVPTE